MRIVFRLLLALLICPPTYAVADGAAVIGTFELKLGTPDNSVTLHLQCKSESNCVLISTTQRNGAPPGQSKQILNNVRPVDNLNEAANALTYAIRQRSQPIKNREYGELMNRLQPVLSASPTIDKCWDLNYPLPGYMLACTLSPSASANTPIYLFGTLLANCGEAFCRYVISPMSRIDGLGQANLEPIKPTPDRNVRKKVDQLSSCAFPDLTLPDDFAVFATGAYTGRTLDFQIDQSGHEATQIDVVVNSPNKPVILMLGAYEPTIWNLIRTENTRIAAVLASGYHRQAIAGLDDNVPKLISTYENRGPCGYFYVAEDELNKLNPLSRRIFGRPVDIVYPAEKGKASIGEPVAAGAKLISSPDTRVDSFRDMSAPLAGRAGLEDAVRKGILRVATAADAEAWANAVAQNAPETDVPPIAGQGRPRLSKPYLHNAYVVLKSFVFPAGLYGANSATFFVLKGVPKPEGKPGHSSVYDFNSLTCQGAMCQVR